MSRKATCVVNRLNEGLGIYLSGLFFGHEKSSNMLTLNAQQLKLLKTDKISEAQARNMSDRNERQQIKQASRHKHGGKPFHIPAKLASLTEQWTVVDMECAGRIHKRFRRYALTLYGNKCFKCEKIDWPRFLYCVRIDKEKPIGDLRNTQILCAKCKNTGKDYRTPEQINLAGLFTA